MISRQAEQELYELGITVVGEQDGMLQLGDQHAGLYDPIPTAAVLTALDAVREMDGTLAERFEAFHAAADAAAAEGRTA